MKSACPHLLIRCRLGRSPTCLARYRGWVFQLWAVMVLSLGGCIAEKADRRIEELAKEAKTVGFLYRAITSIKDIYFRTNRAPPTEMEKLVKWITRYDPHFREEALVDTEASMLRDAWGRDIRLILEEGKLSRLGSMGRNGVWDGGKGDDIVSARIKLVAGPGPLGEEKGAAAR